MSVAIAMAINFTPYDGNKTFQERALYGQTGRHKTKNRLPTKMVTGMQRKIWKPLISKDGEVGMSKVKDLHGLLYSPRVLCCYPVSVGEFLEGK